MKNKKIYLITLFLVCISLVTFIFFKEQNKNPYIDFTKSQSENIFFNDHHNNKKPLIIAFASVMSPDITFNSYKEITNILSKKLNQNVILLQRKTYKELNNLLESGEADIAFLSTGAYASYRGAEPIEILAMVKTKGTIKYDTYIIVNKNSSFKSFKDLKDKRFAFTDPYSYSGKLAVDNYLMKKNTNAKDYFKSYFYTYSHDKSIFAVANNMADAASIDSQIYDHEMSLNSDMINKIRIIDNLGTAPTGPVVIRKNLANKEEIKKAFFSLNKDEEAKKAMKNVIIDEFVIPDYSLYSPLVKSYNEFFNLGK